MRQPPLVWQALESICGRERIDLPALVKLAEAEYPGLNRSGAVRNYALLYWWRAALDRRRPASPPLVRSLDAGAPDAP